MKQPSQELFQVLKVERLLWDYLKIGVLIPDTVRIVTVEADEFATIPIVKSLKLCPKGMTSISIQSVPSVVTPSDPTTPIETVAPIVVSGTFKLERSNG